MKFLGYHGCNASVADAILNNGVKFSAGQETWDWLGSGVYFWKEDLSAAKRWASQQQKKHTGRWVVVEAEIESGLCLDLATDSAQQEIMAAYADVKAFCDGKNVPMPENSKYKFGIPMQRRLDHAVINNLHTRRLMLSLKPYDTLVSYFDEGEKLYPNAGFRRKPHTQICVRSHMTHIDAKSIIQVP